jgi:tetratricopeptide (TPR) repeat protein
MAQILNKALEIWASQKEDTLKFQISFLTVALAISPALFAQAPPAFLSTANYTLAEEIAPEAPSSPLSTVADSAPCSSEPVITFKADSNETSSDIPEQYMRARSLIRKGAWRQAQLVLKRGIQTNPDSRHLRMVYADLLWHLSGRGKDQALLGKSSRQAIKAMEIGLDLRIVDQQLVALLSDVLSRTHDIGNFERLFARALTLDSSLSTRRYYAVGLSRMNSPLAEDAFKAAVAIEDGASAHADYGEWLLDHRRYADVLTLIPQEPNLYYLLFLRGVASEQLGRPDGALKAYEDFRAYSKVFPAPARFRIKGSKLQRGIHFDDETRDATTAAKALSSNDAIYGLSYMIYGEAVGENYGGKLAVGWVARARVHRGRLDTSPNPCPFIDKSQYEFLPDAYKTVICQGFDGACDAWCANPTAVCSTWNQESQDAAYDVYYGYKADPVSQHCPSGFIDQGDPCSYLPRRTCWGDLYSYKYRSPLFQIAASSTTGCGIQQSCAPNVYGKICANGGIDHCFSGNLNCVGPGRVSYSTTLSQGSSIATTSYQINFTTPFVHLGHLETPEGSNFDLHLEYSSNGVDWADYYSYPQRGAMEETQLETSFTGYFRWRIIATQGTGQFQLCAKQPQ